MTLAYRHKYIKKTNKKKQTNKK